MRPSEYSVTWKLLLSVRSNWGTSVHATVKRSPWLSVLTEPETLGARPPRTGATRGGRAGGPGARPADASAGRCVVPLAEGEVAVRVDEHLGVALVEEREAERQA